MSNLKELNYAIISELRDQLEAKEQMIKELKKSTAFVPFSQRLLEKKLKENKNYRDCLETCLFWFKGIIEAMNNEEASHNRNLPIYNFHSVMQSFADKIDEVLNVKR